MIFLEWSKGVY